MVFKITVHLNLMCKLIMICNTDFNKDYLRYVIIPHPHHDYIVHAMLREELLHCIAGV